MPSRQRTFNPKQSFDALIYDTAINSINLPIGLHLQENPINGWQLAKMKKSIPDMSLP